jgi:hypothetical protein
LGHPVTNLSEGGGFIRNRTPVELNHGQVSGVMNTQPGPPAAIDSAGLENGGTERPPSASNSPHHRTGKRILRPTKKQALHPSRKSPSYKAGKPQPVAVASLGPAHPLKVSKPTANKRPRPQQQPQPLEGCPLVFYHCLLVWLQQTM